MNSLFPRPKAKEKVERPQSGTVYKIIFTNCSFLYYSQTEWSLRTGITEHKRAVSMFNHDSKISRHVYESNHEMHFKIVRVAGHEGNFQERLFVEAWMSLKNPQSGNDNIVIPSLWRAFKSRSTFSWNFTRNFLSARSTRRFFLLTRTSVNISADEGLSTSRNVLTKHQKESDEC